MGLNHEFVEPVVSCLRTFEVCLAVSFRLSAGQPTEPSTSWPGFALSKNNCQLETARQEATQGNGPLDQIFSLLEECPRPKIYDHCFRDPNFPKHSVDTDERAHAALVLEKAHDLKKFQQRLPPPEKKGPPASLLYLAPPQEKGRSASLRLFPPQGKCLAVSPQPPPPQPGVEQSLGLTNKRFKVGKGSSQKEKAGKKG